MHIYIYLYTYLFLYLYICIRGACAADAAHETMREQSRATGSKTVEEAGLTLRCAACAYLVPGYTIISANDGNGKVNHPKTPGCPKAGDKSRQWSIASRNWKRF